MVDGRKEGYVEIGYRIAKPDAGAGLGPFLAEERTLLDGVALHIARMISDRRTSDQLRQSERIAALGQLTGGIAHDFNNLLQVILGNSELLAADEKDPARRSLSQMTAAAARRGAELTHRLLSFARRQTLSPERTDLSQLVLGMQELLARAAGNDVETSIDIDPKLSDVDIDAPQLESTILNLSINARDAMPNGGQLKIALSNVILSQHDIRPDEDILPGPYVQIAVSDTGTGISPEIAARIFEPFFTTKPTGQGNGLGLSMVFGFIRQSHGCIRVVSEVGRGTSILLYLPFSKGGEVRSPQMEPVGEHEGTETVLVVDDDKMVRDQVSWQLHALGYNVQKAENGHDALRIVGSDRRLKLVIADVVMPGNMTGFELAKKIRANRPDLPIILMSGYSAGASGSSETHASDYRLLKKPFGSQELGQSVRRALAVNE